MNTEEIKTLCGCGRPADGIDAVSRKPICRQCAERKENDSQQDRLATDGGRDVGIQHDLDDLPDDFNQISRSSRKAIAGGFARRDVIKKIRKHINSNTTTKTDRMTKNELVELLIFLEEVEYVSSED